MNLYLLYQPDTGEVVAHQLTEGWPTAPDGLLCWACRDAYQWERVVRVVDGVLELSDVPVRRHPRPIIPEREELLCQMGHGGRVRGESYDPISDQLDRITKALAHLKDCGVDIGEDGDRQVDHCQSVKSRFPKPVL